MRFNPGPFEPVVYLLQKPVMFRAIGIGGLLLFTILAFSIAISHGGTGALMLGLILLGALWLETSTNICRRCRFYGTWHCLGQGMAVSKLFSRIDAGVSDSGALLHVLLQVAFFLYGLFWMWHSPLLGFIFTLWIPIALITATSPAGFSWRAAKAA